MAIEIKRDYDKSELAKLKKNYLVAKALRETDQAIMKEIKTRVLSENEFYETEKNAEVKKRRGGSGIPERITDPVLDFLMTDNVEDLNSPIHKYWDLCRAECVKAGYIEEDSKEITIEDKHFELYRSAKNMLIEFGITLYQGISQADKDYFRRSYTMGNKLIDIVMKLPCDPIPENADELLKEYEV